MSTTHPRQAQPKALQCTKLQDAAASNSAAASPKAPTSLTELHALSTEQRHQFIVDQLGNLLDTTPMGSPTYWALLSALGAARLSLDKAKRDREETERLETLAGGAAA